MKRKRLASLFFSLVICISMMPMTAIEALASSNADAVSYIYYTVDGNTAVKHTDGICEDYTAVTSSTASFDNGKWYVVSEDVRIGSRITVNGTANLILCDGVKLDTEYGITVNAGNTLNIYAQSEGTGHFSSGKGISNGACIGGLNGQSCGTVNIHGGIIEAVSDRFGSGIGTGDGGIGGSINIFDGKITAESDGGYRAGIGGGTGGRVDSITIYGGTVDAKQLSTAGAAIGGGNGCDSGDITINGGTVTAHSCGAGIGGGENGSGGNITINGGNVTATGMNYNAGIGGGRYGNGGNVTINGGSVTASGYRGVGAGQNGTDGTLTLGENVTFKAGADKDSIWVSGDNDNVSEAFGKKYFEATDVLVPVEYIYYTADGNKAVKHEDGNCTDYKKVKSTTTAFEDGKWYIVKGDVELGDRLTVAGTSNLILLDGATLTASKGIAVSDGNTLNIYGQSEGTGSLVAQTGGEVGVAAVGGNVHQDGGSISIHGVTLTAAGTNQGAGIGGGAESNGGSLTVFDGKVSADGGEYSAAIGGGRSGDGGNTVIYGGTVNATADGKACGIGGGYNGYSGNITINGGTVNASGGDVAIGGTHDQNGSVTINGGTVTATGDYSAINYCTFALGEDVSYEAGAGKDNITVTGDADNASEALGPRYVRTTDVLDSVEYIYYTVDGNQAVKHEDGNCEDYIRVKKTLTSFEDGKWYVVSKDVTIDNHVNVNGTANIILCDGAKLTCTRGTGVSEGNTLNIYAQKKGTGAFESNAVAYRVAGIGGSDGDDKENCGTINIHGGVISAKGSTYGAGIGGGYKGDGGTINVFDGNISADGHGGYAAGIGGGKDADGGNLTIYGGTVNAKCLAGQAAIGGGENGSGGNVTINGGAVTAKGEVGIGGGVSGSGGNITINGGNVTAEGWSTHAAGIGCGKSGDGGNITINGGTVTAKSDYAGVGGNNVTLTLGDGVTFAAGADKDHITVTGNKSNSSDAFGNKYFESPWQHTHVFDQELAEAKYLKSEATCTDAAEYFKSCKCGESSDTDTFTDGKALGHKYGKPSYSWNEDKCTAKRSCTVCEAGVSGHTQTETAEGTYVKDTDADCTNPEKGHYEASFDNEAFEAQQTAKGSVTKGEALGHDYESVVTDPTYTKKGYTTYTCSTCGYSYTDNYTDKLLSDAPVVKISKTDGKVKLSWDKVNGADKYLIYRSTDGKTFKRYSSTQKTTWINSSVTSGKKYYYKVKASATEGDTEYASPYSTVKSTVPLTTPVLKAALSSGKVKLSWVAVKGANTYKIYRSTDGKTFSYYGKTTKTSYTNSSVTSGKTYYYKVKAIKTSKTKSWVSSYSTIKSVKVLKAPAISISTTGGKVKLSWKAVSGASKYKIYRSTDGSSYKSYSTTINTSYVNSSVTSGKKYYYKVKSVNSAGGTSAYSAVKSARP